MSCQDQPDSSGRHFRYYRCPSIKSIMYARAGQVYIQPSLGTAITPNVGSTLRSASSSTKSADKLTSRGPLPCAPSRLTAYTCNDGSPVPTLFGSSAGTSIISYGTDASAHSLHAASAVSYTSTQPLGALRIVGQTWSSYMLTSTPRATTVTTHKDFISL